MLRSSYLKALELASPDNISMYYIGVFKSEELAGIALVEHVRVYVKDMFQKKSSSPTKTFLRDAISRFLKGNILVLGNLTHTGQHGLCFLDGEITLEAYLDAVFKSIEEIEREIKNKFGKRIKLLLLKDYFVDDQAHELRCLFQAKQFSSVSVQPNMVMAVESKWIKMEDYVNNLNTKYRTRYKRARKKFGNFEKRELNENAIESHSNKLHELYANVSDNAKFNTFFLPEHHFLSLKKELRENFKVFGYFHGDNIIGFYTLILNQSVLETYFLGYDSEYQHSNQLYLNMLYDMLDFAITNKFESVVYARTAMEIKSSVGAEPKEMVMYIKHTTPFANSILRYIFNFMKPNQKWEKRHPFK